jgi:hypothetical protein
MRNDAVCIINSNLNKWRNAQLNIMLRYNFLIYISKDELVNGSFDSDGRFVRQKLLFFFVFNAYSKISVHIKIIAYGLK